MANLRYFGDRQSGHAGQVESIVGAVHRGYFIEHRTGRHARRPTSAASMVIARQLTAMRSFWS